MGEADGFFVLVLGRGRGGGANLEIGSLALSVGYFVAATGAMQKGSVKTEGEAGGQMFVETAEKRCRCWCCRCCCCCCFRVVCRVVCCVVFSAQCSGVGLPAVGQHVCVYV